jgi:hypothetical protein
MPHEETIERAREDERESYCERFVKNAACRREIAATETRQGLSAHAEAGQLDLKRGRKAGHKKPRALAHARPNVRSNAKHAPPHGAAAQPAPRAQRKKTARMREKKR